MILGGVDAADAARHTDPIEHAAAFLSDAVADAKIREQVQARVFPVRPMPEEWICSETAWLLDVIAPSQRAATAIMANSRQVVQDYTVRVHPVDA